MKNVSIPTKLGWVSFLNDCSSEVIARALPLFLTTALGVTPTFVGVVEGVAETVSVFMRGFSGWLSDRLPSRKPLVVFGYVCSLISRVTLIAANVPILLGLSRIFDRTGKGLRAAPRDAFVADVAAEGKAGEAFGITRLLDTFGAVTGIAIALYFGVGDMNMDQAAFLKIVYVSIPFGILCVLFLIFFIPNIKRKTTSKKYLSLTIPKKIRGYLIIVGIFSLANSSDAFLVLRAREIGFNFRETLIILAIFNLFAAILAVPIGKLSDRFDRTYFLIIGWFIYACTYWIIGNTTTQIWFTISVFAYGCFYGFTEGVEKALLSDLLSADERGIGYGALQFVLGVSALPASFLMGWLMTQQGSQVAFNVTAGFALAATVSLVIWRTVRLRN